MKIAIAPDSFKGTLSAPQVCAIWRKAFADVWPQAELVCIPMSDGGDGALDAVAAATGASLRGIDAEDALGRMVRSKYALLPDGKTAFIETAAACGIALLDKGELNPMLASSYGAGQIIKAAIQDGAKDLIVGIGGSATVDGGVGMLQALGVKFLDSEGAEVPRGGQALALIDSVDTSALHLEGLRIRIASDVTNPLVGSNGAAAVFGPQKGADRRMVEELNLGLINLASVFMMEGLAKSAAQPGDGAAGGMGFALRTVLGAEYCPGASLIAELVNFKERIQGSDLVITGEGRSDAQTLCGKLPAFVADAAHKSNIPVLLCSGALEDSARLSEKFDAVFSAVQAVVPLDKVLASAQANLLGAAKAIAATLRMAQCGGTTANACVKEATWGK